MLLSSLHPWTAGEKVSIIKAGAKVVCPAPEPPQLTFYNT